MTTYEEVKKLAEAEVIRLTGEEARELWGRVHKEAIEPNAIEIVNIVATGDIAVVAWDLYPTSLDAAESMGYDGKAPVFRLSNKKRKFAAQRFRRWGTTLAQIGLPAGQRTGFSLWRSWVRTS